MPFLGNLRIDAEIAIFLFFLVLMFQGPVTTNLILYRTCYVTLGFNKSECALLGTDHTDNKTAELEEKVQPHAALILMTRSFIEAIVPPILCFFIGPWSDKYGRKPVILFSFAGFSISYLIMLIVCALSNISPWFFVLSVIPVCISGGFASFFTALLSYITDVTSEENIGIRMGVFEAMLTLGVIIGILSSSYVLNMYGYIVIYSICICLMFLGWAYTLLFIKESVQNIDINENKYKKLFTLSLMKESVTTLFRRRNNYDRAVLLSTTLLLITFVLTYASEDSVIFLYLREKFHWSLKTFTYFSSINNASWIFGSIVGAYVLNKLFHISETAVMLLGLVSCSSSAIFLGLAITNWEVYTAGNIKCFGGAVSPMARSLLSKTISPEESGKIFSIVTSLETVGALVGAPIYTYIYNSTISTFPGLYNFLTAGLFIFNIILTIAIVIMRRFSQPTEYNYLNEENSENQVNTITE